MPRQIQTPGVYVQEIPTRVPPLTGASTSVAVIIGTFPTGTLFSPVRTTSAREQQRRFGRPHASFISSVAALQFFENGGSELWTVCVGHRAARRDAPFIKALSLLPTIPRVNLLVIPETVALPESHANRVMDTALLATERAHAIYLLDPQLGGSPPSPRALSTWINGHRGLRHRNVVMYAPLLQIRSPSDRSRTITIPPSGAVAGLYARTDAQRGVWKAPAGVDATLSNIHGLTPAPAAKDMQAYVSLNVNPIKPMTNRSFIAWGARTLSSDPEWKYVPVRRLALYLETSLTQGLSWAIFEPNDEPLWARVRSSVETFLHGLFRKGAFQGSSAREAYVVRCGQDTMTAADQSAGRLNVVVGFAPLKPAEFVTVRISLKTRQR